MATYTPPQGTSYYTMTSSMMISYAHLSGTCVSAGSLPQSFVATPLVTAASVRGWLEVFGVADAQVETAVTDGATLVIVSRGGDEFIWRYVNVYGPYASPEDATLAARHAFSAWWLKRFPPEPEQAAHIRGIRLGAG